MSERVYSIRDMEVITGIRAHTIRMWERRYGLLKPSRTDTNFRYYEDRELRRLMNVAYLVGRHHKISKVARLGDEELRQLVLEQDMTHTDEDSVVSQFVMQMLHLDGAGFSRLLEEVVGRYGFEEAVHKVIFPFLRKVGTFWLVGSVFPAQEHFVSALIRNRFVVELEKRQQGVVTGSSMLFFLHEDELHELPLLFYAVVAAQRGFRVIYLGPGVPLEDLGQLEAMEGLTHVLTVFTNALEENQLSAMLARMAQLLPGRQFFVTGHQLKLHKPFFPEGFTLVENYRDFVRLLS